LPRAVRVPREDAARRESTEQTAKRLGVTTRFLSKEYGIRRTTGEDVGDA
jgi:hypothetical protein